jgi:predicted transcriptional regulator
VRPASATDAVPSSATIRIQCIKVFREEGALTLQECSDLLNLPVCLLKPQFYELRQLGILEQGGTRRTSAGNEGVYRLNESHPTLDFVFGARPEGMKSPRELLSRTRAAQERWEGP